MVEQVIHAKFVPLSAHSMVAVVQCKGISRKIARSTTLRKLTKSIKHWFTMVCLPNPGFNWNLAQSNFSYKTEVKIECVPS